MKKIVFKFFCLPFIGKLVYHLTFGRIPNLRWKGFRFYVPPLYTNPTIQASIFWGFYESAETRLIQQYLRQDFPVVELGGSLGIVSSHIVSRLNKNTGFTVVEANPNLISTIQKNIERHNVNNLEVEILNKAVGYNEPFIYINISRNNTASYKTEDRNAGVKVESISLSDVTYARYPHGYSLVCDIEGSEIELLQNDSEALSKCRQIFIELHDVIYKGKSYTVDIMVGKLINGGFKLVKKDGNVFYLENVRYGNKE